jgi:membrane protein implicated in regulation of membrane protease activity
MIDTPEKPTETLRAEPKDESGRRVWWIVGGAFTGAVLLFALTVAGVWIWVVSSPEETASHTEEYTQLRGVELANEIGDIELSAAEGDVLVVHRATTWRSQEPEITEDLRDDVLAVEGDCDRGPFTFFGSDQCAVEFTLLVPADVDAEIRNSVGEIHLDGLEGAIDVESNVGDVEGTKLRTASTDIDSDVGSVRLEYAQVLGDIDVSIETGDIEIIVPDDGTTYEVVVQSSIGSQDIDIATDPASSADYVIRVTSSVGDISVRYAD